MYLQLDLAKEQGLQEKQREFLWRISDAYDKAGYLDIAENHLKELLEQDLSQEQKLEALCFMADIQVCVLGRRKLIILSFGCRLQLLSLPNATIDCGMSVLLSVHTRGIWGLFIQRWCKS